MEQNQHNWDDAALERGRRLFCAEVIFERGAVSMNGLPVDDMVEIAFAGRSNVGKSSIINALTGRKSIARTSNTPGRTRELNLFTLGQWLRIVDMPGYGYAKAPKEKVRVWTELIYDYLKGRVPLRRVFVLIDGRHGIKDRDMPVLDILDDSAVSYQIVLTKVDKLHPGEYPKLLDHTRQTLSKRPAAHPNIHLTSSEKGLGLQELRAEISELTIF